MDECYLNVLYGFRTDLPGGVHVGESRIHDKFLYLSYKLKALFGSAEAHYALGILSLLGEGTKEDFGIARNHFEKAEAKGHALSAYNLSMLWRFAEEGSMKPLSFSLLEKAAELGYPEGFLQAAEVNLYKNTGFLYIGGLILNTDLGVDLYTRGLKMGAKGDLFEFIQLKIGDPEIFLSNASEKVLDLMIEVGNAYYFGNKYISADRKRAFLLYSRLAPYSPRAKTQLAQCYLNGGGVAQDAKKGFQLLCEITADNQWNKNKSGAYTLLGICYLYGTGTPADGKKARFWLQKAVDYGAEEANAALGDCYRYGYGAATDYPKAIVYFHRSADDPKDPNAARSAGELAELYFVGAGCQQDGFRAYYYAEIAANGNIMKGYYVLANCYFLGKGVKQDYKKALENCKKALSLEPNNDVMREMLKLLSIDGNTLRPVKDMKKVMSDAAGNAVGEVASSLFNTILGAGFND